MADARNDEVEIPLTTRVRANMEQLQPAQQRVGAYVIAHPIEAASMTIASLAAAAGVSEATVVRFCRAVGVQRFAQLGLELATELGARELEEKRFEGAWDIQPTDPLPEALEKIARANSRSVQDTVRSLDLDQLALIGKLIAEARRTEIMGIGASGLVAEDFQQKLFRIGLVAFSSIDAHQALVSASLLGENTVAIGISDSGTTRDVVDAIREATEQGALTVGITNSPKSPLAQEVDHLITTAAFETTYRSAAMGSRLAQLLVVDCLFTSVAHQTFDATSAALESTRAAVAPLKISSPPRS